ncbi:tumor necrosis factor receptor superfamily member 21-like protein [Anopheles sinensis]|uniref:Tumor necrosis factor receptor superfamily member 21-like protein n=1 Tax=Anopheles sinensis TaxID=74873 RepID=A0A084WET0_ANOSI|nr:tumor necrosis factor receptor superfamily member 21-like protein [Anopheles sinensis]
MFSCRCRCFHRQPKPVELLLTPPGGGRSRRCQSPDRPEIPEFNEPNYGPVVLAYSFVFERTQLSSEKWFPGPESTPFDQMGSVHRNIDARDVLHSFGEIVANCKCAFLWRHRVRVLIALSVQRCLVCFPS